MTITKNYNGSITVSDIKDNQYYHQLYFTIQSKNVRSYLNNIKGCKNG